MWTLVFLVFVEGVLQATAVATYETMYDCFMDREQLVVTAGGIDGRFPPNMQSICIYREGELGS
jgi:hypothetical protein